MPRFLSCRVSAELWPPPLPIGWVAEPSRRRCAAERSRSVSLTPWLAVLPASVPPLVLMGLGAKEPDEGSRGSTDVFSAFSCPDSRTVVSWTWWHGSLFALNLYMFPEGLHVSVQTLFIPKNQIKKRCQNITRIMEVHEGRLTGKEKFTNPVYSSSCSLLTAPPLLPPR